MTRIAVCTTFPLDYPTAEEMLVSFDANWPKDVELFIAMDKIPEDALGKFQTVLNNIMPSGRQFHISNEWSDDKEEFFKRNSDSPNVPYRFHVCKFSHKVFTLSGVAEAVQDFDYLIWLDADVITHSHVMHDNLIELLPNDDQAVSLLQRTDAPHSECSFVAYNLKNGGKEIIKEMHEYYKTDKVLELAGWTDCDVLDAVIKDKKVKNLSEGIAGWHVFPESLCGKYMEHRKGQRKLAKQAQKAIDVSNMNIKTRNCLPNEQIVANIQANIPLIKHWADYVKPHDEEIVICSAGPSLSYADIKPWADKGVKIIAVKHAIERLKAWGIKPWACVLLDPRPHVEEFIKEPDKDVIYFVASMVDPSVVKTLLEHNCTVVGYHAFVNAGETKILPQNTMLVAGGSGTATRCIGLLHECLGFKQFHCYGYDLCYYEKPDFTLKNESGDPKYMEVTLSAAAWGNKQVKRTFWTEGQLLAQAKELYDLYKMKNAFNIYLYGTGIAAWQYENHKQYKQWYELNDKKIEERKANSQTLESWENGIRTT
jgi:hypothetical protein